MSRGYSPVAVLRLLIVVASLIGEHGIEGMQILEARARRFSSCGFLDLEHKLNSCGARA